MYTSQPGWRLVLLAALSMGYGWGWRGDYGHELGAMLPGALVAMAVCLASGRRDWWERCLVCAMFGAIGWGFGGSQSYGIVLGYTLHGNFWGIAYGYGCLFVVGALWGAIGGAFLGLAATESRRYLNEFIGPMAAVFLVWALLRLTGLTEWCESWGPLRPYDVDWPAATAALVTAAIYVAVVPDCGPARLLGAMALGWWAGFSLLTLGLGLRMTPPRSDNWAGILGIAVVLAYYLWARRNEAARLVMRHGALFGGLGFAVASMFLSLQITYGWGISGWRLMEQSFGAVMGAGIGLAFLRLRNKPLAPPEEDAPPRSLDAAAVLVLAGMFLLNLANNVNRWLQNADEEMLTGVQRTLHPEPLGFSVWTWFQTVGLAGFALVSWALLRHQRGALTLVPASPLGRGQLLYLTCLWFSVAAAFSMAVPRLANTEQFFSQFTFGVLTLACSWIVLTIPSADLTPNAPVGRDDVRWRGQWWSYGIAVVLVAVTVLVLAFTAATIHPEPLPNSHYRFAGPQTE